MKKPKIIYADAAAACSMHSVSGSHVSLTAGSIDINVYYVVARYTVDTTQDFELLETRTMLTLQLGSI